jgi:glycosyltransferase involved in cell wall biosynthesis
VKLAFVAPWYGIDIPGGAEAETRRVAEHLRTAGFETEVWTTCVRDFYSDWGRNYHRPGIETINGVPVQRFPVMPRDRDAFDAINWKLMNDQAVTEAEERIFLGQMLRVEGLYEHIARQADRTLLFFIPYMFATTYYGAQIRPDRSYVIPCFHDEAYARLRLFRPVFEAVKGMLFLSAPEQQLAARLFDLAHQDTQVVGAGVDVHYQGKAAAFRAKFRLDGPFVLYAGRRDPGKNIELLIEYFRRYRQARPDGAYLVFIGPGAMPVSLANEPGILDLGFVSTQDKWDAYAAASVVCQPSVKESFSLTIMEAWVARTPVIVHAQGAVTVDHCQRANGGLYFSNYAEFEACLDILLARPDLRKRLGEQGHAYVLRNFSWDIVIDKYRSIIERNAPA